MPFDFVCRFRLPTDTRWGLCIIRITLLAAISSTEVVGSATTCGRPGSEHALDGLRPLSSAARSGRLESGVHT